METQTGVMAKNLDSVLDGIEQTLQAETALDRKASSSQDSAVAVKAPSFATFTPTHGSAKRGLEHLYAVKLEVEAVLGRAMMSVDEMLNLDVGSVVELDRLVAEPLDLIAQGVRVARGEVVVVNDQFAIRISEITGANS